ncbi:MAG: RHS repeat-associated core domain-containing protein [Deltaproteobacteria bacterium]|nr:RHS repeat-associated core domain-containing protein [Kofleriaceae bacterium]
MDSSGVAIAGFTYSPFGELIRAIGQQVDDMRRRFNGKEHDASTGLHYYGARYYDGFVFMWTQADPLYTVIPDLARTFPRRANRYSFSANNPLRYIDPDGLDEREAQAYEDRIGYGCFGSPCSKIRQQSRDSAEAKRAYASSLAEMVRDIPFSKLGFFMRLCDSAECTRRQYEEDERQRALADPGITSTPPTPPIVPPRGPRGKVKGPERTEPRLPGRTIATQGEVTVQHYYHGNDHGPAHAHVTGGGDTVRIGPGGHPLAGEMALTPAQRAVVDANRGTIRKAINKLGRWLDYQMWRATQKDE